MFQFESARALVVECLVSGINKCAVCILMSCVNRGLVLINIMRRLEELSRRKIHELFDYVCGVSTGALIGAMAAIYRVPVADMEDIYKEFSVQMFARNRLLGTSKLFTSHAYYDTELWERILRCCFLILLVVSATFNMVKKLMNSLSVLVHSVK